MSPLLLALLLTAPPADTGGALRWHATLGYGFEAFTQGRTPWQSASAEVGRRFDHGAVIGQVLAARRFGLTDGGVAVDAYRTLWPRAYGNLRVQVDPGADVLPRLDVAAELFHGVRGGFEFSAGYRRMQYAGDHADLISAGAGAYAGNWYLRSRAVVVPRSIPVPPGGASGGALHASVSLAVRRYFATADDYLDVQGGLGEEVIATGAFPSGPLVEVRRTRYLAATFRTFPTPRLGLSVGATFNGTDGFPDRRGLTAGVTTRW